jgi:hypothetical protein
MKIKVTFCKACHFILLILLTSCNSQNEIAKIKYSYSGCFASGKNELLIYEKDGVTKAKLDNGIGVILSPSKIDSLNVFIQALRDHDEKEYCTTVVTFKVATKDDDFEKTFGDCEWRGFSQLTDLFFHHEK